MHIALLVNIALTVASDAEFFSSKPMTKAFEIPNVIHDIIHLVSCVAPFFLDSPLFSWPLLTLCNLSLPSHHHHLLRLRPLGA
jgi:hypothetical protein